MKLSLAGLGRFDFVGTLLLRIGLGALIVYHGFPIFVGGKPAWADTGSAVSLIDLGSSFYWPFGLASAVIQVFGGAMIALGLLTRGMALLLAIVVGFALANLIADGSFGLSFFAYLQVLLACLALVLIGPGRLSLDRKGI